MENKRKTKKSKNKKFLYGLLFVLIFFIASFIPFKNLAGNYFSPSNSKLIISWMPETVSSANADIGVILSCTTAYDIDPLGGEMHEVKRKIFKNEDALNNYLNWADKTEQCPDGRWEVIFKENILNKDIEDKYNQENKEPTLAPNDSTIWTIGSWIGTKILRVLLLLYFILAWLFYSIAYSLVSWSEWILGIFFKPDFIQALGGFTTENFVKETAKILANLCNMLYLVFLLYIAVNVFLGKADTYRLLIKLVIAALLTNFALVLSGVIIDASQVMMHSIFKGDEQFKPGTSILDNLEKVIIFKDTQEVTSSPTPTPSTVTVTNPQTGVTKDIDYNPSRLELYKARGWIVPEQKTDDQKPDSSHMDGSPSFWEKSVGFFFDGNKKIFDLIARDLHLTELVFFGLAMVITLLTITLILLIRIVALWVLLILSPVALTFSAFPPTEKYFQQWFDSLTKYAFTGPILFFFLWLGNKISENINSEYTKDGSKLKAFIDANSKVTDTKSLTDDLYVFIVQNFPLTFRFFVLLFIIWAGIIIANQFGIKGAKSIDGLMKSTQKLPGRLLSAISSTGGAVARGVSLGTNFLGKSTGFASTLTQGMMDKRTQRLNAQAEKARTANRIPEAENIEQKAKWWKDKKDVIDKSKNKAIKAFSVMNPLTVKKQFSAWWAKKGKEYSEHSEESVNEFGRDMLRFVTMDKGRVGKNAEISSGSKINTLERDFKEKYRILERTNNEIAVQTGQINVERTQSRPRLNQYNQKIQRIDQEITIRDSEIDRLRQDIKNPPAGTTLKQLRKYLEEEQKHKKDLQKEKTEMEEKIKAINNPIEEREEKKKLLEGRKNQAEQDLKSLGASIAELSTEDEQEKIRIEQQTETIISNMGGRPLPNNYSFVENLNNSLRYTGNQTIRERAKELARKEATDLLTTHVWQKEKFEKAIREKLKEIEEKGYSFDQLEDMAKSGYGDSIMRSAIFRRLASSPKNFGNMLLKTFKDFNNDEEKAMEFLKQRFSEPELIRAFQAADTEARKSNNLFTIGYVTHDPVVGKTRLSRGTERLRTLANFARGMTPDNINKINPQTFQSKEGIEQLALNTDWEKLARNPRFIDGMSQQTRMSFKSKQREIEGVMTDQNKIDAFRNILKV